MAACMAGLTSTSSWLSTGSGMVQTQYSALASLTVPPRAAIGVGNGHPGAILRDLGHGHVMGDDIVHMGGEGAADHVHAANRLEHGGLHRRNPSGRSATARALSA